MRKRHKAMKCELFCQTGLPGALATFITELRYTEVGQSGERYLDSGNTTGKGKGLTS